MIELFHHNTDYAEQLDMRQQVEFEDEMENRPTFEEEELSRFKRLCKKHKVSYRQLKKEYERVNRGGLLEMERELERMSRIKNETLGQYMRRQELELRVQRLRWELNAQGK